MYMPDLSTYLFHSCEGLPGVLPVGWLSEQHPFKKGTVSREILQKLTELAVFKSTNFMRGFHRCEFCSSDEVVAETSGVVKLLGSAELWIPGKDTGVLYAAPNLIVHYMGVHHYQPPDEYLSAVEALDPDEWAPPKDYVWKHRAPR